MTRPGAAPGLVAHAVAVAAAAIAVVILLAAVPASVLAHGGQVVVEPAIAAPGTELSIHGDYLWTDMPVTVTLAGTQAPRDPIATAMTDGTGHLEVRAVLPDVRAGKYRVVVTATSGEAVEADLIVQTPDLIAPLVIGFVALVAGVVIVGALMRRRTTSNQQAGARR